MASRGFNYSKWDNIELSDDESDLHPNIDKDSWFRMKHRTRLEREEREDQEIQLYIQKNSEDNSRLNIINARIKGIQSTDNDEDAEFDDIDALRVEKQELEAQIKQRQNRIAEIKEKRSWNIDNICKVTEEKTIVNSPNSSSLNASISTAHESKLNAMESTTPKDELVIETSVPNVFAKSTATAASVTSVSAAGKPVVEVARGVEPAATLKRERLAVISYNDYVMQHEALLEKYSEISDLEATSDFLFKNCDVLLHEHAQSYMLLSCLEDEMNGKKKRMKLVCRQSQILSHIQELGVSMKRDPRDVIIPFFRRVEEKEHMKGFLSAVDDFIVRIQKRAVEKRKEMDAERIAEQKEKYQRQKQEGNTDIEGNADGTSSLDPYEVLESLPDELRAAFESQDIAKLQQVLAEMDPVLAKHSMKQCVDSGLWVPKDKSIFEEGNKEVEEEDDDEEEEPSA